MFLQSVHNCDLYLFIYEYLGDFKHVWQFCQFSYCKSSACVPGREALLSSEPLFLFPSDTAMTFMPG